MSDLKKITGDSRCVYVIETAPSKAHLREYGYEEGYMRMSHDTDLTRQEALAMARELRAKKVRCRVVKYVPVTVRATEAE